MILSRGKYNKQSLHMIPKANKSASIPSWTWFSSKAKRIHNLFDDLCFLDGGHSPEENSKVKLIHYSCDWTGPPYASTLKVRSLEYQVRSSLLGFSILQVQACPSSTATIHSTQDKDLKMGNRLGCCYISTV